MRIAPHARREISEAELSLFTSVDTRSTPSDAFVWILSILVVTVTHLHEINGNTFILANVPGRSF